MVRLQGVPVKRLLAVSAMVLFASMFAMGQDIASFFGGYQYTNVGQLGQHTSVPKGWNFDVALKVARHTSIVGDFAGAYKNNSKIHTGMLGPRYAARFGKVTPFVQGLIGGARGTGSLRLSMDLGGGIDVSTSKHLAWRVAKIDYNFIKDSHGNLNNVRVSTGIVLRF
jgi:hypothetical protein